MAWQSSQPGGMTRNAGQVVAIDEAAPVASGAIPIESGAIVVDEPPPVPPVRTERPRKSTLERFNDELAVLERPLEGDVEYIDEKPPRRWRPFVAFAATVAIVGGGGSFMISHHRAAVAAASAPETPRVLAAAQPVAQPAAQPAAPPAAQPILATAVPPAPGAAAIPAAGDAPAEDDSADDDADQAPVAPSAWTKVKAGHGGHTKHARVVTTKHHHLSKRTVAAKHARHR